MSRRVSSTERAEMLPGAPPPVDVPGAPEPCNVRTRGCVVVTTSEDWLGGTASRQVVVGTDAAMEAKTPASTACLGSFCLRAATADRDTELVRLISREPRRAEVPARGFG